MNPLLRSSRLVFRSTSVEKVDDELVSGHDDGGVWDLSDEVSAETPVEPPVPLFLEDCYQGLEECPVLVPFLP